MNTADRSLAMLDYALRRRFSFFTMKPGFNTIGFQTYQYSFKRGINSYSIMDVSVWTVAVLAVSQQK